MKTFLLLITFLILNYPIEAQWSEQLSGVTTTLLSVSAIDNNIVWASGENGTVIRTTDGGKTWVDARGSGIPSTLTLNSICGIDANKALVTGSSTTAFVFRTTDAGINWTQTFAQDGGYIYGIVDVPAAGNYGIHSSPINGFWWAWFSSDGGITWSVLSHYQQDGSETGWNNSLCVYNATGWHGTNNSRVYKALDGYVWFAQPTPGLTSSKAIWFSSLTYGMVGGDGMVLTTDGGSNWTQVSVPGTGDIMGIQSNGTNW